MVMAGGISLVDFSVLVSMSGSKAHLEVLMLGSGADPSPDTPLLISLEVANPRCALITVLADGVHVYRKLPLQSASVVTDSPACRKGAGMSLVNIDRLRLPCRCWLLRSASSMRRKYLSVGRVVLISS